MLKTKNISKIGIGTWGIGGLAKKNLENDDKKQISALVYQFNKGINFIEVNNWYAQGYSMELISEAIKQSNINREDLFLMYSIYGYELNSLEDIEDEVQKFLKIFNTNYIDSIEFLQKDFKKFGFEKIVKIIKNNLDDKTIRYVGVANASLDFLKQLHQIFGDKLFSHETHYSLEIRETKKFGIIDYDLINNIKTVIFQPLRRDKTAKRNWPILLELSKKYKKTQNQIILNWLVSQKMLPIIKSDNIKHIDENIASLDFQLKNEDILKLNNFKIQNYKKVELDWFMESIPNTITLSQLPNNFDELYPKN